MATVRYTGKQVRRVEKQSITVTAAGVGGTLDLTINTKVVRYTCITGDTTTTAAANWAAAIRAAEDQEFKQFQVEIDSTTVTQINFTANDSTRFISVNGNTVMTSAGAGGATLTSAVTQAGLSPCDANEVLNYSGGALPANSGDTLVFEDAPFPAKFDWASLSAKSFAAVQVLSTFTGNGIGLPKFAPEGYEEYRGGRWASAGITALTIDLPAGAAFESYRFDVSSAICTAIIRGQGGVQVGAEAVDWVGTHASNTMEVIGGSVRVAPYTGDVSTLTSLKIVAGGAVTVGSGVTLATVINEDSALDLSSAVTSAFSMNGEGAGTVMRGSGTMAAVTLDGGILAHNGTGTIASLIVGPGATADFSGSKDPITITAKVSLHKGSTFWDPHGRVTLTAGWQTVRCTMDEVITNFGPDRNYTVS